ncbi:hypothetical protein H2203_000332 [Taxawa tesnikishii (nom. ined.)]|nr:hypothetical protein H2203_000332 [Dothideales sp. JES 119]
MEQIDRDEATIAALFVNEFTPQVQGASMRLQETMGIPPGSRISSGKFLPAWKMPSPPEPSTNNGVGWSNDAFPWGMQPPVYNGTMGFQLLSGQVDFEYPITAPANTSGPFRDSLAIFRSFGGRPEQGIAILAANGLVNGLLPPFGTQANRYIPPLDMTGPPMSAMPTFGGQFERHPQVEDWYQPSISMFPSSSIQAEQHFPVQAVHKQPSDVFPLFCNQRNQYTPTQMVNGQPSEMPPSFNSKADQSFRAQTVNGCQPRLFPSRTDQPYTQNWAEQSESSGPQGRKRRALQPKDKNTSLRTAVALRETKRKIKQMSSAQFFQPAPKVPKIVVDLADAPLSGRVPVVDPLIPVGLGIAGLADVLSNNPVPVTGSALTGLGIMLDGYTPTVPDGLDSDLQCQSPLPAPSETFDLLAQPEAELMPVIPPFEPFGTNINGCVGAMNSAPSLAPSWQAAPVNPTESSFTFASLEPPGAPRIEQQPSMADLMLSNISSTLTTPQVAAFQSPASASGGRSQDRDYWCSTLSRTVAAWMKDPRAQISTTHLRSLAFWVSKYAVDGVEQFLVGEKRCGRVDGKKFERVRVLRLKLPVADLDDEPADWVVIEIVDNGLVGSDSEEEEGKTMEEMEGMQGMGLAHNHPYFLIAFPRCAVTNISAEDEEEDVENIDPREPKHTYLSLQYEGRMPVVHGRARETQSRLEEWLVACAKGEGTLELVHDGEGNECWR